jgi:hypothetical protein
MANKWKKEVGKIERGGKFRRKELISKNGSNCGMLTLYGFSRIQNLYE